MARTIEVVILGKDQLSGALRSIGGGLRTFGSVAAVAIAGTATALTGLAVQAAPVENIRAAFENLAESSGQSADTLLAALQEGSAGMVAQSQLMKSYNMSAQLVSQTFADQLPDAMKYLGKVSAATGEDMGYLMDSLVRGVGRLSPMILDNLQIQVDLSAAYEAWSGEMGVAVDEMTKQEQQAALTAQVMQLLAENTAELPDVVGTAAQELGMMDATVQDFKDTLGMAFLPVLHELLPIFKDLMSDIAPVLIEKVKQLADWFSKLPRPVKMVIAVAVPLAGALGGISLVLAPLAGLLAGVPTLIGAVISALGALSGPIGVIIAIVAALGAAWATNFMGIRDKVQAAWDFVQPIFQAIGYILDWLKNNVLYPLRDAFQMVWAFIVEVVRAAWAGFKPHIDEMYEVLADFWEEMQPRLEEAWTHLQDIMRQVAMWIQATLIPLLKDWWDRTEGVRILILALAGAIGSFLGSQAVSSLKMFLQGIITAWDLVASAIGAVSSALETLIGWISAALEAWGNFVGEGVGAGLGGAGVEGAPILQSGLAYVPSVMPAILHPGEAVLSRTQADVWRQGGGGLTIVNYGTIRLNPSDTDTADILDQLRP